MCYRSPNHDKNWVEPKEYHIKNVEKIPQEILTENLSSLSVDEESNKNDATKPCFFEVEDYKSSLIQNFDKIDKKVKTKVRSESSSKEVTETYQGYLNIFKTDDTYFPSNNNEKEDGCFDLKKAREDFYKYCELFKTDDNSTDGIKSNTNSLADFDVNNNDNWDKENCTTEIQTVKANFSSFENMLFEETDNCEAVDKEKNKFDDSDGSDISVMYFDSDILAEEDR